jgi:hypothetical protein
VETQPPDGMSDWHRSLECAEEGFGRIGRFYANDGSTIFGCCACRLCAIDS